MNGYLFLLMILILTSCTDFLEVAPKGELSESTFETSEAGVEGIVIGVYSLLNGQYNRITNAHRSGPSNWVYGDVVSDDAYKGSSGISDGSDVHQLEVFQAQANNAGLLVKWEACYEAISRANKAIPIVRKFAGWSTERRNIRLGELRVLRGHYYFELKKIYNRVPYVDETVSIQALREIGNRDITNEELWSKIEKDFIFGTQHLPATQQEPGRVTKVTAWAYLAKTYLYQQKWQLANEAAQQVIDDPGTHKLLDHFEDVFLQQLNSAGAEVCDECLLEVQHSLDPSLPSTTPDVGSTFGWDGNVGDRLSGLGGPYPRVYGFHTPSQNLVNAYKTTSEGLPLFERFNERPLSDSDRIDPRLDHTVGRPGVPFFDAGDYSDTWTRGVITYGPFAGKKQMYPLSSNAVMNIPYYANSENYCIIRLADLYLMKAEAMIELGDLEESREWVNRVRRRARDGRYVRRADGTNAANYYIEEYTDPWTDQDVARKALQMERRLELAMEGHRFFDLVRWGIAEEVINRYLKEEAELRTYMNGARFVAGKHEYFPIPLSEIQISEGKLKQNTDY